MPERDHAVVVGSGTGGLLAARVVSETFDEVTIVERDVLPWGQSHAAGSRAA